MIVCVYPEHGSDTRRRVALDAAKAAVISPDVLQDMMIAVTEVVTDDFLHGGEDRAEITIRASIYEVAVCIRADSHLRCEASIRNALYALNYSDPSTAENGRGMRMLRDISLDPTVSNGVLRLNFPACTRAIVPAN